MSESKTITLFADTLQYTSEGLRTIDDIELTVGTTNRIVVRWPSPVRAVPLGVGGFQADSAFPTPVALASLFAASLDEMLRGFVDLGPAPIYQVYGHASADGGTDHNKALSDRRAKVFGAFLTGDVEAVASVAKEEAWGVEEQQVMLRVLRCDPGVIDGDAGALTQAATRDFQEEYNDGVFHGHAGIEPAHAPLKVDGVIGSATMDALVDAFVVALSPRLEAERMHPTHPTVGCADFNRASDSEASTNRRIALVVHRELPPYHDRAPCTEGDASVCPVDQEEPQRCLWYRAHVADPPADHPHGHADLRWLPLPNGRILLSALTTLLDEDAVTFEVFRSKPIGGPEDISDECLGEPLSERMEGIVRLGVAQVVWEPPAGYDPYDFDEWFMAFSLQTLVDNPAAPFESHRMRPPLFRVTGGGASKISEPPGQDLRRIRLEREDGEAVADTTTGWGYDTYGRAYQIDLAGRRQRTNVAAVRETHRVMTFESFSYLPRRKGAAK